MKKFMLFFIALNLLIYMMYPITLQAEEIDASSVDAMGAILLDYKTGKVLWEKNGYSSFAMASTTKIMTAIITLEMGNMEDTVTVSKNAAHTPKVRMELSAGEEIKLKYLLYALMLQSSNDAAVAIAEHIGGTVDGFCRIMTDRAKELGAKDTVFETPNGLDKGDHHSTAYDLAVITRYALSNPDFIELINTSNITATSSKRTYNITNKNRLLNEYEGANGVKTGFTGKAGHCFVGAAKRGDMQLISVVLASGWGNKGKEQKWRDTKKILNYGFKNFKYVDIVKEGSSAGEINIGRSKTDKMEIYYDKSLQLPLTPEEVSAVSVKINSPANVKAPVKKGEVLGTADVYIKDSLYTRIALVAEKRAERHDFKTSLEKVVNGWFDLGTTKDIQIEFPELFSIE